MNVCIRLDDELAERFMKVKQQLGLKANTEVVRTLITLYWHEHPAEEPDAC